MITRSYFEKEYKPNEIIEQNNIAGQGLFLVKQNLNYSPRSPVGFSNYSLKRPLVCVALLLMHHILLISLAPL